MSFYRGTSNKAHAALVFFIVLASHAHTQTATAQDGSAEALQQRIGERDAAILELQRRVEALEQKLAEPSAPGKDTKPANQATTDADSATEEEPSRALERTLVRERGIVLPPWSLELDPQYTYSYRGTDALRIVTLEGQQAVAQENAKADRSDFGLNLRLGLPWSSQIDFRVPYVFDREVTVRTAASRERRRRSGLGDVELGWTKQLLQEKGWMPDLLTTFNWKSDTGNFPLGNGFHGLQAGVTAVKRRDPLALFGSFSHTWSLSGRQSGRDVDLGNTISFKLGTLLATSPDTSLRFALEISRTGEAELSGRKLAGSNRAIGFLEVGLATLVLPRTLMDVRLGVGLTSDSPDFRLGVSFPVRLFSPSG